jgi:hypothetical protein
MSDLFQGLPDNVPKGEEEKQESNLPQELQGKSPEEMYQLLSNEHQREVERLKAQKLDEMQQSQQSGQQESQQQQSQQQYQQPQQPTYSPSYSPYGQQSQGQQQSADLFTDPDRFMDEQFNRRLQPLAQSYTQSLKETNKQQFINSIGNEEWEKYGSEIQQFIDSLSPQIQIQPQAFQTAYNFVRAQHVDEIASQKATQQASEKLQETLLKLGVSPDRLKEVMSEEQGTQPGSQEKASQQSSSLFQRNTGASSSVPHMAASSGGGSSGQSKGKRRLSETERKLAEEFGMSEDEYSEYASLNTDLISNLGGENG